MRVIFLDIDGVLNCSTTRERYKKYIGIDSGLLHNLKELVNDTSAEIVLVSTWKENWIPITQKQTDPMGKYLNEMFSLFGLTVMDKTEDDWIHRGQGILNWLSTHDVDAFVILDDEMFDYHETCLAPHLVRTDWKNGFKSELIEQAKFVLRIGEK